MNTKIADGGFSSLVATPDHVPIFKIENFDSRDQTSIYHDRKELGPSTFQQVLFYEIKSYDVGFLETLWKKREYYKQMVENSISVLANEFVGLSSRSTMLEMDPFDLQRTIHLSSLYWLRFYEPSDEEIDKKIMQLQQEKFDQDLVKSLVAIPHEMYKHVNKLTSNPLLGFENPEEFIAAAIRAHILKFKSFNNLSVI